MISLTPSNIFSKRYRIILKMFTFKFYYCFQFFPMINIFFNAFYDIHNRKEGISYHTCQLVFYII